MSDSRVRWQCRRGMRELDELLMRWFDRHYAGASEAEKTAFRELLSLADPDLVGYLLSGRDPDREVAARVIRQIRDGTGPG